MSLCCAKSFGRIAWINKRKVAIWISDAHWIVYCACVDDCSCGREIEATIVVKCCAYRRRPGFQARVKLQRVDEPEKAEIERAITQTTYVYANRTTIILFPGQTQELNRPSESRQQPDVLWRALSQPNARSRGDYCQERSWRRE